MPMEDNSKTNKQEIENTKKKNYDVVFLCASIYHLFIALMVAYQRGIVDHSMFLLTTHEKRQYEHFERLQSELRSLGIEHEIRLRNKKHEFLGIEVINTRLQYQRLRRKGIEKDFRLINFSWNFSGPFRTSSFWYNKAKLVEFFEEGAMCYATPQDSALKRMIKRLCGIHTHFHYEDKLMSIFVQKPEFFPSELQAKIKELNIENLANKLSKIERSSILKLFLSCTDRNMIDSLDGEKGVVIFTQPLSEDGYITENHKVELYNKICEKLSSYGKVIVKLHPRDKSEYHFSCTNVVLPSTFPSELMVLLPIKFYIAAGICTSAVIGCNAERKINLNNDYLKTLDESFINRIETIIYD